MQGLTCDFLLPELFVLHTMEYAPTQSSIWILPPLFELSTLPV